MEKKSNFVNSKDLSLTSPGARRAISSYVNRVVSEFGDQLSSIILYGSQSRGEAEPDSDIDLFVIIRRDTPSLRQALADIAWQVQFDHNVVISDTIRSVEQFREMRERRFPYYQTIEQEGIVIWKNTSEHTPAYA